MDPDPIDDLPRDTGVSSSVELPPNELEKPASQSGGRTDYWCYTLNNPTEDDQLRLKALHTIPANRVVYHCFQLERAPDTGTLHLQGFIAFATRVLFQTAKKRISDRAHIAIARGTPAQNTKYCTKVFSSLIVLLNRRKTAASRGLSLLSSELSPLLTPQERGMIY